MVALENAQRYCSVVECRGSHARGTAIGGALVKCWLRSFHAPTLTWSSEVFLGGSVCSSSVWNLRTLVTTFEKIKARLSNAHVLCEIIPGLVRAVRAGGEERVRLCHPLCLALLPKPSRNPFFYESWCARGPAVLESSCSCKCLGYGAWRRVFGTVDVHASTYRRRELSRLNYSSIFR